MALAGNVGASRKALGVSLVGIGVSTLSLYLWQFATAVTLLNAQELEASLQQRGLVFWLIFLPALVPAGVIFMYIMWIGYKMYIHSPEDES